MQRQALQQQMLQGATMEQLRDNQSMVSNSDLAAVFAQDSANRKQENHPSPY